jgi:hypothetical protein
MYEIDKNSQIFDSDIESSDGNVSVVSEKSDGKLGINGELEQINEEISDASKYEEKPHHSTPGSIAKELYNQKKRRKTAKSDKEIFDDVKAMK